MSSSSSSRPAGVPRTRIIRGGSFVGGASPLAIELPVAARPVDPAAAAAEVQRGYDDGYREGRADGRAAGRADAAAEHAAALAGVEAAARALAAAADDLRRRQALELVGLEDTLARTAFDLAAAIVGRELQLSASPGADALARALGLVPAGAPAVARLHPDDVALLGEVGELVTVIADPVIERGGCVLEVGDSRIDAQLGSALDRVRAALLSDPGRSA